MNDKALDTRLDEMSELESIRAEQELGTCREIMERFRKIVPDPVRGPVAAALIGDGVHVRAVYRWIHGAVPAFEICLKVINFYVRIIELRTAIRSQLFSWEQRPNEDFAPYAWHPDLLSIVGFPSMPFEEKVDRILRKILMTMAEKTGRYGEDEEKESEKSAGEPQKD
jgi:hypothetical protein